MSVYIRKSSSSKNPESRKKHNNYTKKIVKAPKYFLKRKNSKTYIHIYSLEICNHGKFYSCKIYIPRFVKLFLWDTWFSQNSFKEELATTNNMIIY